MTPSLAAMLAAPLIGGLLGHRVLRTASAGRLSAAALAALALTGWTVLQASEPTAAWLGSVLCWLLLALSLHDLRAMVLPDVLTLPLLGVGLGLAAVEAALVLHLAAAGVGYGLIAAVRAVHARRRGVEGIGLGDAKLLAAAGAWVGPDGLPSVLLIASVGGLLAAAAVAVFGKPVRATTAVPFGPFLAGGFLLVRLHGALPWGAA